MLLLLGLMACLALWWLSKTRDGFGRRLGRALGRGVGAVTGSASPQRIGGTLALAASGFFLLRGNLVLAALLGLGGLWMLEGPQGIAARFARHNPFRARPRRRTGLVEVEMRPDCSPGAARVIAGPHAGARFDDLPTEALAALARLARLRDPEGAAILEAYLDRRAPGWRIDAEGDPDPRAGRAPDPGAMTQKEAYQVLGLQRGASREEIRTAHRSLMKLAHPDQGGSAERATRVNAARDRLLSRHR